MAVLKKANFSLSHLNRNFKGNIKNFFNSRQITEGQLLFSPCTDRCCICQTIWALSTATITSRWGNSIGPFGVATCGHVGTRKRTYHKKEGQPQKRSDRTMESQSVSSSSVAKWHAVPISKIETLFSQLHSLMGSKNKPIFALSGEYIQRPPRKASPPKSLNLLWLSTTVGRCALSFTPPRPNCSGAVTGLRDKPAHWDLSFMWMSKATC